MPKSKVFSIRLDSEILEALKEKAKKEDRSVNYIINKLLKQNLQST